MTSKKKKIALTAILFILILLLLLLALLLIGSSRTTENDDTPSLGFGDFVPNEQTADSNDGSADIPNVSLDESTMSSPNSNRKFNLNFNNNILENTLQIEGTDFVAKGVVNAVWSLDESIVVYTVVEQVDEGMSSMAADAGRIFVVNADGSSNREVFNFPNPVIIGFVSNGASIGYASEREVGVIDITTGMRRVLYEFESERLPSDVPEVPSIFIEDEAAFVVEVSDSVVLEFRF